MSKYYGLIILENPAVTEYRALLNEVSLATP
jgi:hypothetical protein